MAILRHTFGPVYHPTKSVRYRIYPRYNKLNHCCQAVYDKCNATISTLRKLLQTTNSTVRRARKKSFEYITNRMPLVVRMFVQMQANSINKKMLVFKEEEKLLCLALYTANPPAYKFMSTIFKLPHKRTLHNFGLNIKGRPPKSDALTQHADATKTERATPAQTPNSVPKLDVPIVNDKEVLAAVAAITSPAPAPVTPACTAAANPAHAELLAELEKCLPAPPKLPQSRAMLTNYRGRCVRHLKQPPQKATTGGAKTTPNRAKKPHALRDTTIKVFKLAAGTTCEDVASHVSAIVPHYLVRCRKILTKVKGPAFILEVPLEHKESVLDPSFWPERVVTWARGTAVPFLDTMLTIRVFNVAEGTTVSDMIRHICQVVPENKMTCVKVDSVGRGETFKMTMPRRYLKIVAASSFWPTGIRIARMRTQQNPRKKRGKRANRTDLDPAEGQASKRMRFSGKFPPNEC